MAHHCHFSSPCSPASCSNEFCAVWFAPVWALRNDPPVPLGGSPKCLLYDDQPDVSSVTPGTLKYVIESSWYLQLIFLSKFQTFRPNLVLIEYPDFTTDIEWDFTNRINGKNGIVCLFDIFKDVWESMIELNSQWWLSSTCDFNSIGSTENDIYCRAWSNGPKYSDYP